MNRQTLGTDRNRRRVFYGWWVIGASIVGMSTGPAQFAFGSLGLFILPLGDEFGWDRAEISLALTFFTVALAISLPVVGRIVDRIGSRPVLVPSMIVCGLGLAAIALVVSKLWHFWLLFAVIGSLGAGANSLPYMRTISAWFNRKRGLAIGITMAGAGLGYTYVPPLVQYLNDTYGWRSGYYVLAAITVVVAAPLVAIVFRETPADLGLQPDGDIAPTREETSTLTAIGRSASHALRHREFWLLFTVFCALSFSLYGVLPHLVPLLTDGGMASATAALAASTIGITITIARVAIGYLIDRFFAPSVALVFFLLSSGGLLILALAAPGALSFIAAVLIGLSIGAEVDLLAFLTTRYFGLRSFGVIYGYMFAALLIGTSLGPLAFGTVFETTGSYVTILSACAAVNAVASFVLLALPPYPDFESGQVTPRRD